MAYQLWFLWQTGAFFDKCKHWVNQSTLPKAELRATLIAVPPLPEQQRIVEKLQALQTRVDACRDRLDKIPAILKRFRQSVLAAACSGRLTEDWRANNNPIPEDGQTVRPGSQGDEGNMAVPGGWCVRPFRDLFGIISGNAFKKSEYSTSGLRLFQIANVGFGRTLWDQRNYLPLEYAKKHEPLVLRKGDICIALNRPILGSDLKVALLEDCDLPAMLYQRVGRLREKEQGIATFAFMFMRSNAFREEVRSRLQGTDQPYLNFSHLSKFVLPTPPLEERREIVRRVNDLFQLADVVEKRYETGRAAVENLTQSILAKAFRGELVPQDPTDEPASVLLERIRGGESRS